MNMNLFREKLVSALGENLVFLVHTGSRVRGEARPDSDYDFAMLVKEINRGVLNDIRVILTGYSNISVYILDKKDLEYFPRAQYLQFVHSVNLYGECDFPRPGVEDIDGYVNMMRRNEIDALRHYITIVHDADKLVGRISLSLKYAYICLTYLLYKETGVLPRTRLETINHLERRGFPRVGVRLLRVLDDWSKEKKLAINTPREYLHTLEEFWRNLEPRAFALAS